VIALHKQWRGLIHSGRVTRLTHDDADCCAFMASDGGNALVSVAQLDTPRLMPHLPLRLSGLDNGKTYKATLLNPMPAPQRRLKVVPENVMGVPVVASGAVLAQAGLTLPVLMVGEIAVFSIEEIA
jgi:alpha-galactosidase